MRSTFIQLEDLRVDCLIGVWSHERKKTQQIRVDITVEFDAQNAALEDDLEATLNYADVSRDVAFILEAGQFKLLESATWMIQQWLLAPPPTGLDGHSIRSVEVRLTKFGALTGSTLATVRSHRERTPLKYGVEHKEWGSVDIIGETNRLGFYRLNVAPGQTLPTHYHDRMREEELILSSGLVSLSEDGEEVLPPGRRFAWPRGVIHGYRNEGDRIASILCMDSPPFLPEDERVV